MKPVLSDLTVVLPTLGRPLLEGCLESILEGDYWPERLVVSEQGSRREPAVWIERLREAGMVVEHLSYDERGCATATNRALAQVSTRFVAITHDDCRVDSRWAINVRELLLEHGCVVSGRVLAAGDGSAPSTRSALEPQVFDHPSVRSDPYFGNNSAMPMSVLEKVGLFDEDPRLYLAEDCEFSHRLLSHGVTIRYEPSVMVWHESWRDHDELDETYRGYAFCLGVVYGKYLRKLDGVIARRTFLDLLRAPWFLLRGFGSRNQELQRLGKNYLRYLPYGVLSGLRAEGTPPPAWL